ncbi:MAG: hypothetical protein QGI86_24060 [Candidatus Poribacteria bacterium]|nr:hypothetical protein [Candidatus Poribacteria bacterium]MDP6745502.1 hypothetical protein [Candidatus Poribacteria bacterium]MDP6995631.1 hypothetical protein [Candidatus Poribacteria bacterium]
MRGHAELPAWTGKTWISGNSDNRRLFPGAYIHPLQRHDTVLVRESSRCVFVRKNMAPVGVQRRVSATLDRFCQRDQSGTVEAETHEPHRFTVQPQVHQDMVIVRTPVRVVSSSAPYVRGHGETNVAAFRVHGDHHCWPDRPWITVFVPDHEHEACVLNIPLHMETIRPPSTRPPSSPALPPMASTILRNETTNLASLSACR